MTNELCDHRSYTFFSYSIAVKVYIFSVVTTCILYNYIYLSIEFYLTEGPVQVRLENESTDFLLCTLIQDKIFQQALDLNVNEGESVTFYIKGNGM